MHRHRWKPRATCVGPGDIRISRKEAGRAASLEDTDYSLPQQGFPRGLVFVGLCICGFGWCGR